MCLGAEGPPLGCEDRPQSLLPEAVRVNVPRVVSERRPQAKPKMGQHFLASEDLAARVVDALGDISQSTVLEIGPGRGIMTSLLARRARRLIAVCGLEWEPACLEFHRTRRAIRTASVTQVRQPIYTQSIARWRNYERELAELFARLPAS